MYSIVYDPDKESDCSHCNHLTVCKFKDDYQRAKAALDDLSITCDSDGSIHLLRDYDWLHAVLKCDYYDY